MSSFCSVFAQRGGFRRRDISGVAKAIVASSCFKMRLDAMTCQMLSVREKFDLLTLEQKFDTGRERNEWHII